MFFIKKSGEKIIPKESGAFFPRLKEFSFLKVYAK